MLKISKTISVFSFSLLIALASFSVVGGQENTPDDVPEATTAEMATNPEAEAMSQQQANNEQSRKDRIAARKEQRQEFMSQAKEQRLVERCSKAQDKLKDISTKIASSEANRVRAYDSLLEKLGLLTQRLQAAQQATDELTITISELSAKVAVFEAESNAYKLIIADVIAMDCAADPQGFLATLQSAREQISVVKEAAKSTRLYVAQELRPLLELYKTKAEASRES